MITHEKLHIEIKKRLYKMAEARTQYLSSRSELEGFGIHIKDHSRICISDCFESVTGKYIDELCDKLSKENSGGTMAKIDVSVGAYKIISHRIANRIILKEFNDHDEICNSDYNTTLIDIYLNAIDFKAISDSINNQAKELYGNGLKEFAGKIINKFNLCPRNSGSYFNPYTKGGRIICPVWPLNYHDYDAVRKTQELIKIFSLIEKESCLLLCDGLYDYYSAGKNLCYSQQKIPYRSCFGKGSHVEIYCFKEKHEFRFSRPAFEAILAFLSLNGESEAADHIIEKSQLLEAA